MRRNVLRRTLSEDLDWAECRRQQEPNCNGDAGQSRDTWSQKQGIRTKSYEPTPERKAFDEHCVSDLDDVLSAGDMTKTRDERRIRKKGNKGKERRARKDRLSLTASNPVLLKNKDAPKNLKKDDSTGSLASYGVSAQTKALTQTTQLNQQSLD